MIDSLSNAARRWLLGCTLALASVTLAGTATAAPREVLRFNLVPASGYYVDNDPAGPSGGDLFGSRGPLRAGGDEIGSFRATCTAADAGSGICEASLRINGRGTVELSGPFYTNRDRNRLAVVGGTRSFRRASGVARLRAAGENGVQRMKLIVAR